MLKDRNFRAGFKNCRFKAFRLMKGSSLQLRHYTSLSEVNKRYLFEFVQHRARVAFFSESSVNGVIYKEQFSGNAA